MFGGSRGRLEPSGSRRFSHLAQSTLSRPYHPGRTMTRMDLHDPRAKAPSQGSAQDLQPNVRTQSHFLMLLSVNVEVCACSLSLGGNSLRGFLNFAIVIGHLDEARPCRQGQASESQAKAASVSPCKSMDHFLKGHHGIDYREISTIRRLNQRSCSYSAL